MQRVGYLFDDLLQYENLLIAFKKARKGTKTGESLKFEYNLERELLKLKKKYLRINMSQNLINILLLKI